MNDHLPNRLCLSSLTIACLLAACGGGGSSDVAGTGAAATVAAVASEFDVLSGGAACGSGGCGGDGAGGGASAGGDGGDGAGGGLGAMRNVKVTARKPDGTVLGSAPLLNNLVSLYPRTYKGAFILEFADDGSGSGQYFDEAKKAYVSLSGEKLRVLVPALAHHLSATPLTEAAYQWALGKYGTEAALTAARMTEANGVVLAAFNGRSPAQYQVTDVTNYAVAVSDVTTANSLPNTSAGRYGTLLAAMPRAAGAFNPALAAPAIAFQRQLVADIRDDGSLNSSAAVTASTQAYGPDLTHALADAVVAAKTDYGTATQPTPTPPPSVCFNPALYAVGSSWSVTNDTTDSTGTTTSTQSFQVTRRTTAFKGLDALELQANIAGTSLLQYYSPDLSSGVQLLGDIISVTSMGVTSTVTTSITASAPSRQFLLRPGETQTRSISSAGVIATPRQPDIPVNSNYTEALTLVGYEDVVVPAGTFKNACKYTSAVTFADTPGFNGTSTYWITSSGQGIGIKSTSNVGGTVSTSVLRSGVVNGVAVR